MVPMSELEYVSEASLKKAEAMERKFLGLNKSSGVIFIGIRPIPTNDGECSTFFVTLGVEKTMEEGTAVAIIKSILSKELQEGLRISMIPVRGISGPAAKSVNIN